jgi:hypothetical protein
MISTDMMAGVGMDLGNVIGRNDGKLFVVVHTAAGRAGKTEKQKVQGALIQWKNLDIMM